MQSAMLTLRLRLLHGLGRAEPTYPHEAAYKWGTRPSTPFNIAVRIAGVTLQKSLTVFPMVALMVGAFQIFYWFRARTMRAFANKWGFRYLGPPAPRWWKLSHFKMSPPLPVWLSSFHPRGKRMTHVFNVIEGEQHGVAIFIFDCLAGTSKQSGPCTVIACQSEQNPFEMRGADRIVQSHGWTVLDGSWFLWFSWTMSARRLETRLSEVQIRKSARPLTALEDERRT